MDSLVISSLVKHNQRLNVKDAAAKNNNSETISVA